MDKIVIPSVIAALLLVGFTCIQTPSPASMAIRKPQPDTIPGHKSVSWQLLPTQSVLLWKAGFLTGSGHVGTLQLKEGQVQTTAGNKLTGGNFIIDMNTIHATDQRDTSRNSTLDRHLKEDHFFDTAKFPTGAFRLTGNTLSPVNTIQGDLTIKGITLPISFPAVIKVQGDSLYAQANVTIDRTNWGITYESENFIYQAKDGVIANKINVGIQLVFLKK